MTVLFVILPKQLVVQNKPQETPAEEKASPWGKQTSAEVAVTWRSFSRTAWQLWQLASAHRC